MSYNCPKCHCGCLFEEKGKLICLNCGAEVSKSAAKGVRHVHTYTTYRGKTPGKRQSVPKKPPVQSPSSAFQPAGRNSASANTGTTSSTFRSAGGPPPYGTGRTYQKPSFSASLRQDKKKRSTGCLAAILVLVFLLIVLPLLVEVISSVVNDVQEAEWEAVSSEDYEEAAWGVAYWYCYDGSLSDELSEKLDTLIYGYNDDHDLPKAEDVSAYLEENLSPDELDGCTYICEQEGDDVCVTFYLNDPATYDSPEDWGIAYWYYSGDGSLPRELAETLDDLLLDYNAGHDLPNAEEVSQYLQENLGDEFDGYPYTCEQDGSDVLVTFSSAES